MAGEQIIYLSPEEELKNVRERLERLPSKRIVLIIPQQTQLRSLVGWRLLHSRARELGKDILIISSDRQIRSMVKAAGFRVSDSLASAPSGGKSRSDSRPDRSNMGSKPTPHLRGSTSKGPTNQPPDQQSSRQPIQPLSSISPLPSSSSQRQYHDPLAFLDDIPSSPLPEQKGAIIFDDLDEEMPDIAPDSDIKDFGDQRNIVESPRSWADMLQEDERDTQGTPRVHGIRPRSSRAGGMQSPPSQDDFDGEGEDELPLNNQSPRLQPPSPTTPQRPVGPLSIIPETENRTLSVAQNEPRPVALPQNRSAQSPPSSSRIGQQKQQKPTPTRSRQPVKTGAGRTGGAFASQSNKKKAAAPPKRKGSEIAISIAIGILSFLISLIIGAIVYFVPSAGGDFLGLPYGLLAVVGLILIILLVLLVSLIVVRQPREIAKFEKDQEAAQRMAALVAQRIRMNEATQRVPGPIVARQGQAARPTKLEMQEDQRQQPVTPPSQNRDSLTNNTIAIDTASSHVPEINCPNCHRLVIFDARFCPNCRFSLKPVQESSMAIKPPPPVAELPVQAILSAPLIPVQPLREEKQDNGLSVQKRAGNDEPPKVINVPPQEAMSDDEKENSRVGQQFGNYKLLRSLGEGGFAEVYLGEHIHLGSYAAIKILSGRLTGKEQEKFRLEARTLVRLKHSHIVRLLDFDIEDKVPFLVMDYAANGSLRHRYPKGSRLPLPLVVNYVKQAAEALQFAHDQTLIHRDIKPENMLLGSNNEILLSDFGIAIVAQSSRNQNPQGMAGTAPYMAPEQIQSHPRFASDQYSLGIVTYEWLCGSRPFEGSFIEIALKHATVSPLPLCEKVSTIPVRVEQVVLKSLAKDPKERFESVQKFAIALEQASLS